MSTWRIPAPHEVFAALCALAFGAVQVDLFMPGSLGYKVVSLVCFLAGVAGTASARNYLSPRVREILDHHDKCNGKGDNHGAS